MIPTWLKLAFTLFLVVWVPLYWESWGPQNFLWFCDIGNFVIAAALWLESPLLFSWQAVSVLAVQIGFSIDIGFRFLFGFHPIGGSEFVFDEGLPLHLRIFALFHLVTPVILIWALRRLGYDRRALPLQTATALVVLPVCLIFFGPEVDLNWVWGPFDEKQEVVSTGVYFVACLLAYPLLLYLPTHLILRRFCRDAIRSGGS